MTFGTISLLLPLAAGNPTVPIPPGGPGYGPAGHPVPGLVAAPGCAPGYPPPGPPDPCLPIGPPAPLFAAKLIAPPGVRVTFLPGSPDSKMYAEPVVVGFRPGYSYRVELTGLPGLPDRALYPEIEVRGSLVPRPGMNYMDHPAAVVFTAADLERAAAGSLVTKVIYLEDPDRAAPVRTTADRPIESPAASEAEAIRNALAGGRLVMIVRLGDRRPDDAVLQHAAIPGTLLLPGEKHLGRPPVPPYLPYCGIPLFDPLHGPRFPHEECLPDGGDVGPRIGIGLAGRAAGINPTDVAVEYTRAGRRRVTTSNRVCVCVPRFAVWRAEAGPGGVQMRVGLGAEVQAYGTAALDARKALLAVYHRINPAGFEARLRPQLQVGTQGIHMIAGPVSRPAAIAITQGLQVVAAYTGPDEVTNFNGFVVTKTIDPQAGVKIGDEVTITIRYANHTRQPVSEVVVTDSLAARFEYVPGSAESDRPATATTEVNEVGSSVVRFDIPGAVQPGQGGVVKFRVRVR